MTKQDMPEFLKLCALMSQAFDKPLGDALAKIYFEGLADFSIEQVAAAVNQAVKTKTFLPKVAELRQLVEGSIEDRASQAWAAFLDAVRDGGMSSVQFFEPAAAIAMDAVFGGWTQATRLLSAGWTPTDFNDHTGGGCTDEMLAHYQKAFLRQYVAALNLSREVELYRPGLSEISMRESGGAWAQRTPLLIQPVIFVGKSKAVSLRLPFDVARGCLTDEARAAIANGWEAVRVIAAPYNAQIAPVDQKALPAAAEEMATPEEVAELKRQIAAMAGRVQRGPMLQLVETDQEASAA